ncbi:MAG: hypothetical protein K2G55_08350 [Lachnospiraceae bacterium]|nr:hypothetical protein [Lachnospiraceae bacterium]MDE7205288.1 hypothetical protein [Lachnospiraceae bacterium]
MDWSFLFLFNDHRLAYVVNDKGNILIGSVGMLGDHLYSNILEILAGHNNKQTKTDNYIKALGMGDWQMPNLNGMKTA